MSSTAYQNYQDDSNLIPKQEFDGSWGGLRLRTKIFIIGTSLVALFVVGFCVGWLAVQQEEKERHHDYPRVCLLPEVRDNPPAPLPERIKLDTIDLPPVSPSATAGSCSPTVNPRGTGCMDGSNFGIQSGSFLPDGNHIVASLTYSGAPAAPDPASIFSGLNVAVLKIDGTTFSSGDPWKCITCGVPANNSRGVSITDLAYPQTFSDGMRILAGAVVIDCSPFLLTDDRCTPNNTFIYPIYWQVSADGSGSSGSIRELRLHPNDVYLGFNSMSFIGSTPTQFGFIGKFNFNPSPTSGTPLVPRYDITNVTVLYNTDPALQSFYIKPGTTNELIFNPNANSVGEFRGWSKDGREVMWIGQPCESGNFDIMSTSLETGEVYRLTRNPEYADPVDMSPDNNWTVVMDTRGSDRLMFAVGVRGIPSIIDTVTSATVASIRNNGQRRFFQPYLIDRFGDRGAYQGQLITAQGDGTPGSYNDPNWNGMADPRWSPNGTMIAFWQALVTSPGCGGVNPLPCPDSTEPGGRRTRIIIATLQDRAATPPYPIPPVPETISWGTPYVPGSPLPTRQGLPAGNYTLNGKVSGTAHITFEMTPEQLVLSASVRYTNYSDDNYYVIDGDEYAYNNRSSPLLIQIYWKSNITLSGCETGKKYTSANGYSPSLDLMDPVVESTGRLNTTLGNFTYTSPNPGT